MPMLDQLPAGEYVLIVAGLFLLALGAEALVRGAVWLALRLSVSPLLIGLTVVAWGTSTPELIVSVNASLSGNDGIAVGNVVGSNIVNILLILGLAALISPMTLPKRAIGRDALFALVAAGLFAFIALRQPVFGFDEGIVFLVVLLGMGLFAYAQERAVVEDVANEPPLRHSMVVDILLLATGLGLLAVGADMLVEGSVSVARDFGLSETVIGLTLVAVGTGLPELATTVVAAFRGRAGISVGNIMGSNIYNILAILGVTALVAPLKIDPKIVAVDMWVMIGATLVLFVPLLFGNRVGRLYGLLLIGGYVTYVWYLLTLHG